MIGFSRLMRGCLVLAALAVSMLASSPRAEAGYLIPFTGNTFPQDAGGGVDGHTNFTVLDTTGGSAGDTFGTGLAGFDSLFHAGGSSFPAGGLDTSAKYLYLFETVNDGTNALGVSSNTVQAIPGTTTSFGTFVSAVFFQLGIKVGPGVYLGGASASPGDVPPSPAVTGPGVSVGTGTGFGPQVVIDPGSGSIVAIWTTNLSAGANSYIWGYTTDLAPQWCRTGLIDGGTSADGTVPGTCTPEPSTMAIAGLGMLGMIGYGLRRRRRGA